MNSIGGVFLVFIIAGTAYGLSLFNPLFDPLVFGIVIGVLVSNLLEGKEEIKRGSELAIRVFLPVGIATYGFQLRSTPGLDRGMFLIIFSIFAALFILTYVLSRLLKIANSTSTLLATGTSICGASAIAVVSSAIEEKEHSTSAAILSIMAEGLILTVFYLALQELSNTGQNKLSLLFGSTLPMLGLVKVLSSNLSEAFYQKALAIKYMRIFFLLFTVPLAMAINSVEKRKIKIPVFMWFFFVFVLAVNTITVPDELVRALSRFSAVCLTITLSAIGLRTSIDSIATLGFRVFLVPVFVTTVVALVILLI